MISKITLTKEILNLLDVPPTEQNIRTYLFRLWNNARTDRNHSMGLTSEGFKFAKKIYKFYRVNLTEPYEPTAKNIINLDRQIKHPYYLNTKAIYLYDQKEAVELILYGGNLNNFIKTRVNLKNK